MDEIVYKVCSRKDWQAAYDAGAYQGSDDDRRDGFIHLSTADQLDGTLRKHFAGQANLVRIAFRADSLGDELKWEPSRGGALFPHLYALLPTALAIEVADIGWDPDGHPRFGAQYRGATNS